MLKGTLYCSSRKTRACLKFQQEVQMGPTQYTIFVFFSKFVHYIFQFFCLHVDQH